MATYLYARKTGRQGTMVVSIAHKDAIDVMRKYRNTGDQIGILGGKDYPAIKRTYGEFAPYVKIETVGELLHKIK